MKTISVTVAIVETMPEHYPHNGAERTVVPADEVSDYVTDGDDYDHVVCEYSATLDEDGISVHDAENHLLGTGTWDGSIVDCPANLGDDVYGALEEALIAAGAPEAEAEAEEEDEPLDDDEEEACDACGRPICPVCHACESCGPTCDHDEAPWRSEEEDDGAQRDEIQRTYGEWKEAERNAAGQRGGGYSSDHQRAAVREAAEAYVDACRAAGEQPSPAAVEAAKVR